MTADVAAVVGPPRGLRLAAESDSVGFALPTATYLILLALLIIGAAMWIGGMVAVTMLAIISKRVVEPEPRTALFKAFGRAYFPVFGAALVVAAAAGFVLLLSRGWDGIAWAITILVVVMLVAMALGVVQARTMGSLRARASALRRDANANAAERAQVDRAIATGARSATILRGSLGVLSAAVFVLAIYTAR